MSAKTDPAEFADAEVVKAKLEALDAKLDKIIDRLKAFAS